LVNERGYLYVLDVLSIARCTGSQYAFAECRPTPLELRIRHNNYTPYMVSGI